MMESAFWLVPFMHRNRNNRAFYKVIRERKEIWEKNWNWTLILLRC